MGRFSNKQLQTHTYTHEQGKTQKQTHTPCFYSTPLTKSSEQTIQTNRYSNDKEGLKVYSPFKV